MDKNKIINFVNEYTNMCQRYGLMLEPWGFSSTLTIAPLSTKRLQSNNMSAITNWERNNALTSPGADVAETKSE